MILDTTFLVDFDPKRRKKICGAAHEFLKKHLEVRFAATFTIAGEGGGREFPGQRPCGMGQHFVPIPVFGGLSWQRRPEIHEKSSPGEKGASSFGAAKRLLT